MSRTLSTDDLPLPLVCALQPWIDAVETATLGMGEEVRTVAEVACAGLHRRVVMTAPIETAIEDARIATSVLASVLDWKGAVPATARPNAVAALQALIVWLQSARPNERTIALGLDW
ncbi:MULTISPECIES: hypothetical protein [unclassified Methylobacterium]|uniref:hypothetical protein n=1 Tax=unclassified Methylobacterium TaxID=2615210 RepID=UPI0011C1ECE3|nr:MULTISPECIES: hypothetical protein [unclassified Methylobacterium]QEE37612.1 hypothetical protein FVA80_00220 [Methylobacterium sp. WL1]TXN52341.1 hypothetical protein FV241_29680 [Methylobacterium sp. WL2]